MQDVLIKTLPDRVSLELDHFVGAARNAFGDRLLSVVLYGSAAEGRLRPTSDVNLLLLLASFQEDEADRLRDPLRQAQATIRLRAMFLLESELRPAAQAFAVKFGDILRRRRVLYGTDPFTETLISRSDSIQRLRQTLLNLTLRLREAYIARGLREEQLVAMIAETAGPLRACAATLLELEGSPEDSPRRALERIASSLGSDSDWSEKVALVSAVRQNGKLPPGAAAPTLFSLIELARAMWLRADTLS